MALVNRSFSVNVTPGMMPPIVHVSEYDVGRAYTVSILDEQGNTFTIPSGTTASIEGTLNGSVGFTQSATISNDQVSFTLSESMTAYAGKAWCKIKLTLNDEPIQTCAFVLAVDRAGVEADTVIGADGFEQQIVNAVNDWLGEHHPASGGMTEALKQALLDCFENVAWINDDGQTYYDALYAALYPPVDVLSISAVFTQGSAVIYDTDSLDTLKQYLVVTATMTDSTTQTVTNYTLSGTLAVGTSTITVSYGGKATTFDVTVAHASLLPAGYQQVEYIENPNGTYMVTSIPVPLGYKVHGKAYLSAKPSSAVNVCGGTDAGDVNNISFCCFSGITTNSAGTFFANTNCFATLADLYASPLEFSAVQRSNNISINLKNSGGENNNTVSASAVGVVALNVFRVSQYSSNPFTGRIYLLEVLDANDQATAKLIPCYRKSDNVVGMYDVVGNAFYASANSTAFTKGGDVA